ncbi:MAG: neutral/alkaline non-lysosomal ceramidase N-terminal domain-containing protein, partial [Myxococcota bacterium]
MRVLWLSLGLLGACGARPGELVAGSSSARLHAPVGIGTAGFGPLGVKSEPSPFSDVFPATTAVHGHPDVKVVYLSRGEGFEALLVRLDMVAVFPGLRDGVLQELQNRLDRDFDDALVLAASHTHSGPGRVIDGGGPYDLVADRFLPEHYERTIAAIAGAVEDAVNKAAPAELGHVLTTAEGHSDRRCEDGQDFEDSQLTMLGVQIDGQLDSLVLGYAIHGTTVGIDELTLTGDVSGAIEDRVQAAFERPVTVAMFNSWGG